MRLQQLIVNVARLSQQRHPLLSVIYVLVMLDVLIIPEHS